MNKSQKLLSFCIIFMLFQNCYGQIRPAVLKIKFKNPQWQANVVTFDNGSTIRRSWAIDSTTTRKDSAGLTIYTFELDKPRQLQILYFSDSTTLTYHYFYLRPNDILECYEENGQFFFDGENRAAKLNRFLHEIGILSQDSLQKKPLLRKVSDDIYKDLMRDKADEAWQLYQTTQDTTVAIQNVFVKASLEAQQYNRIKYFLTTKDWTDDMFDRIQDKIIRSNSNLVANNESILKIPFEIIPNDDALLSNTYKSALMNYLRNESTSQTMGAIERTVAFYDMVDKKLKDLPKTRETLILEYFGNNSFFVKGEGNLLIQRLERDFPYASKLKTIRYAFWKMQKLKVGMVLPPVILLKVDSTQTPFSIPSGQPTFILIWNTWEDSCQIALTKMALMAKKYEKTSVHFITIGIRNRFESWKEGLKSQWPNLKKDAHYYADYSETDVLEGILTNKRPKLLFMDKEGKFVEEVSLFTTDPIEKYLKK
jgi:thiol-disulfide isomerase/thioredoxin